jgi:hypothetical protein
MSSGKLNVIKLIFNLIQLIYINCLFYFYLSSNTAGRSKKLGRPPYLRVPRAQALSVSFPSPRAQALRAQALSISFPSPPNSSLISPSTSISFSISLSISLALDLALAPVIPVEIRFFSFFFFNSNLY